MAMPKGLPPAQKPAPKTPVVRQPGIERRIGSKGYK